MTYISILSGNQYVHHFGRSDIYLNARIMLKIYYLRMHGGAVTRLLLCFTKENKTCSSLEPYRLPPTKRATYYHSLRVHYQVMQWKTLGLNCLNPLEWGWYIDDGILRPIKTDIDAPTESHLKKGTCMSYFNKWSVAKVSACVISLNCR